MMQQLNIEYFFPLTEQIPLELDYEPSKLYAKELNRQRSIDGSSGQFLLSGGTGYTTWATVSGAIEPNFTINIDAMPITIQSKTKPNFFRRYIYKILGMKWKAE
jgi:hypothetical protein